MCVFHEYLCTYIQYVWHSQRALVIEQIQSFVITWKHLRKKTLIPLLVTWIYYSFSFLSASLWTHCLQQIHISRSQAQCVSSYLITVPLAPPAVVSMTLVVRLTFKSSWSRPSRSAQYSRVCLDWFFRTQPPIQYGQTHLLYII